MLRQQMPIFGPPRIFVKGEGGLIEKLEDLKQVEKRFRERGEKNQWSETVKPGSLQIVVGTI